MLLLLLLPFRRRGSREEIRPPAPCSALAPSCSLLPPAQLMGEEVSMTSYSPQLAFYGDTSILALTEHTEWKRYPVIMIECTIYPGLGKSAATAQAMGHMHWEALEPVMRSHPATHFVLIHHSML
eukprot:g83285.t1